MHTLELVGFLFVTPQSSVETNSTSMIVTISTIEFILCIISTVFICTVVDEVLF